MSKTFGKRAEDIKWQDDIRDMCLHIHDRITDEATGDGFYFTDANYDKIWDILFEELEGLFPGLDYKGYN